jgi:hypothetical protein
MIFGASLTSSWNLSQTARLAQHTIIYYDCQYKLHIFAPVTENKQRLAGMLFFDYITWSTNFVSRAHAQHHALAASTIWFSSAQISIIWMWSSSTPRKIFYIESRCDSALFLDTFSLHWTFFSHPLGWWLTGIAHSGTLGPQKGPESKPSGGANGLSGWVCSCASKEKINEFLSPPYH